MGAHRAPLELLMELTPSQKRVVAVRAKAGRPRQLLREWRLSLSGPSSAGAGAGLGSSCRQAAAKGLPIGAPGAEGEAVGGPAAALAAAATLRIRSSSCSGALLPQTIVCITRHSALLAPPCQVICGGLEPKGGPAHVQHRKVAVDAVFARRLGAILKM